MALTYDRENFTAAALNNIYEYARDQLAEQAPDHISKATYNYSSIAGLSIDETRYGTTIQTPQDVFRILTFQLNDRRNSGAYLTQGSNNLGSATAALTQTIYLQGLGTIARRGIPRIMGGRKNGMFGRLGYRFGKLEPEATTLYITNVSIPTTFVTISLLAPDGNVGRTVDLVQGADNSGNIPLGQVESFDSWNFERVNRVGKIEQFSRWPMGQRLQAKDLYAQPYNVLYSGTVRSTADISNQIGNTQTFTAPEYQSGTLRVFWNGQLQDGNEIIELSSTTFSTAFTAVGGDVVLIDYRSNI